MYPTNPVSLKLGHVCALWHNEIITNNGFYSEGFQIGQEVNFHLLCVKDRG